ncbi:hypothetical protein PR048_015248 [Dryococelus australis]|uniref:SCAN domain-containing protein 3 n=1 Tax=Dryococelus australis TaxID=614101 RepID=A0ABQ9HGQ1_9NEOP|nr:hypothetical protein PR048_015248 [Dryococelus australis]
MKIWMHTVTSPSNWMSQMMLLALLIKEELLKLIHLKSHTRGEDIFSVQLFLISDKSPIHKFVSITNDGNPALRGSSNGFLAQCRRDESFPKCLSCHCIIHQQSLCGKYLNMNEKMKVVVQTVNKIRAHHLQRRLFKDLLDELQMQYGELLLHCEARWLSKGKVLQCFIQLLPASTAFMKEQENTVINILEDLKMAFLIYLMDNLNDLNIKLQVKDKKLLKLYTK